jgi:hypothetical protein
MEIMAKGMKNIRNELTHLPKQQKEGIVKVMLG